MGKRQWIGGVHAVAQALEDGRVERLEVVVGKRSKNLRALLAAAQLKGVATKTVEHHALDMRLPDIRHQGVAAACHLAGPATNWQAVVSGTEKPLVLVLDRIQDPHNLGACLRSARAAGVDAVLLPTSRAADIGATVHKVSCGASETVPIFRVANLKREIKAMRKKGFWVVGGVGAATVSLYDLDLDLALVVIVGNEAEGIRHGLRELCDHLAAIPMAAGAESLNVSVACAVILFEARRQRLAGRA